MRELRLDGPGGGWLVLVPEGGRERMRGLRGHPLPGAREGFLLLRCRSVHTVGMTSALGVALLDDALQVVWFAAVAPGKIVLPRRGARHVLECDAGSALRPGDRFQPGAVRPRTLSRPGRGPRSRGPRPARRGRRPPP
jgi:hypothetical protein